MDIRFTPDGTSLILGTPVRKLTEQERHQMWVKVYSEGELLAHELDGYRTVIAWRLTRELAFRQDRMHRDERLQEALTEEDFYKPVTKGKPRVHKSKDPLDEWSLKSLLSENGGVALRPIRDRDHNTQLSIVVMRLTESMWLLRGSEDLPHLGHYGLDGLTHPVTMMERWPTIDAILRFEDTLMDQLQDFILKFSRRRAQKQIQKMLDLSAIEAQSLLKMAAAEARAMMNLDVETNRALQIGQMEELAFKARESADIPNELKAQKEIGELTGVRKADRESDLETLVGIMNHIAAEQSDGIIQVEAVELLPDELPPPKEME